MKVSREQAAKHREHIVETAATLFRERGFDGVGVAELMKAAGLTHGGFYGHFASKEQLMTESCTRAFDQKERLWTTELTNRRGTPLEVMAKRYLSARHRKDHGTGCPLASWAVDASRQPESIRNTFTDGMQRLVKVLAEQLESGSTSERYQKSLSTWATLVGAIVLARATNDTKLADDILQAATRSLCEPDHC